MNLMFEENKRHQFGPFSLSEQEIIDFGQLYDPLDIHIDKEKASKSMFGGLIASGPHIFNYIYRNYWLAAYKETVLCGLELSNWKFMKPVFPDLEIIAIVTILKCTHTSDNNVVVKWLFEFKDLKGQILQKLDMVVLHKYKPHEN